MKRIEKIYCLVGIKVKAERKKSGLNQEELAQRAGISTNFLGHIERGTKRTSLKTVENIARALEIPISALFSMVRKYKTTKKDKSLKRLFYLLKDGSSDDKKNMLKIAKIVLKKKSKIGKR